MSTLTEVHKLATQAAAQRTQEFLDQYGDRDACGFAWVTVFDVKLSTKLGKEFAQLGYSKAYGGGIQLWNPSKSHTQSVSAKEAGAIEYVRVMRSHFPDMKIYSGSRLD